MLHTMLMITAIWGFASLVTTSTFCAYLTDCKRKR